MRMQPLQAAVASHGLDALSGIIKKAPECGVFGSWTSGNVSAGYASGTSDWQC